MPRRPDPASEQVTALQRGFAVLDCFAAADHPLGNGDVAAATGIPKPTVSRLIATLVALGHLRPVEPGDRYQLAAGVVRLAQAFLAGIDIRAHARPHLQALARATGGTCFVGVRDGDDVLIIESARSRSAVSVLRADVGTRMSLATSALGRAWLAGSDDTDRADAIAGMRGRQPDWASAKAPGLEAALACARRHGYVVSLGEWQPGTHAAAVPIRTAAGEVVSINCGGPAFELPVEHVHAVVIPRLLETADALAREIGGAAGLALTARAEQPRPDGPVRTAA